MTKKCVFEKMVLQKNRGSVYSDDQKAKTNRFLITINILGSAGPIRFVVNEEKLVSGVIDTALKSYAREGRLPVLGFDASNFLLYRANAGFDAKGLSFWWNFFDSFESIGTHRILWGEEFCAVQKTGVPPIEDRTTIRVVVSKEQWWMESMVKQIIWFEDLIPLRHLFHVKVF
ncbi:uncharacterized protein LOC130724278 isoform X1 [Lotus japonicus]|uniref:uncharacterized protein LOC130724278 isoform X1 n=1 Tax=Lotus japonicus TaxID=34305 RepID=UPI002582D5A3|nr:uncharacterized protein LOC130724278 isoform X1 [Lotus japonicus]